MKDIEDLDCTEDVGDLKDPKNMVVSSCCTSFSYPISRVLKQTLSGRQMWYHAAAISVLAGLLYVSMNRRFGAELDLRRNSLVTICFLTETFPRRRFCRRDILSPTSSGTKTFRHRDIFSKKATRFVHIDTTEKNLCHIILRDQKAKQG